MSRRWLRLLDVVKPVYLVITADDVKASYASKGTGSGGWTCPARQAARRRFGQWTSVGADTVEVWAEKFERPLALYHGGEPLRSFTAQFDYGLVPVKPQRIRLHRMEGATRG